MSIIVCSENKFSTAILAPNPLWGALLIYFGHLSAAAVGRSRVTLNCVVCYANTAIFDCNILLFCHLSAAAVGRSRVTLNSVVCYANICICLMSVFENKFSANISQIQQSSIATSSSSVISRLLRSVDPVLPGFCANLV